MSSKKMSLIEAVKHITAGRKPTQPVKKLVEQDEPEETLDGIAYEDLDGEAQEIAIAKVIDVYQQSEDVADQFSHDCDEIEFKPTSWGTDRDNHVKGDFEHSADSTAKLIMETYGETTDIYKIAKAYTDAVKDEAPDSTEFLAAIQKELDGYTEGTEEDVKDLNRWLDIEVTLVDGKFTDAKFLHDASEVTYRIFNLFDKPKSPEWIDDLGEALKPAAKEYDAQEENVEENKVTAVKEFRKELESELASKLQKEYDYWFSKEAAIDTIEANDIKFNEDGTIFNGKKTVTEAKEPKKEEKEIAGGKTITIVAFDENGGLEKLLNAIKEIDPGTKITIEGEEEVSISWESVIKTIAVEDVEEEPKEEKKEKPKKPKAPKKAPKDKEEPVEEEEPEEVIKESKKKKLTESELPKHYRSDFSYEFDHDQDVEKELIEKYGLKVKVDQEGGANIDVTVFYNVESDPLYNNENDKQKEASVEYALENGVELDDKIYVVPAGSNVNIYDDLSKEDQIRIIEACHRDFERHLNNS